MINLRIRRHTTRPRILIPRKVRDTRNLIHQRMTVRDLDTRSLNHTRTTVKDLATRNRIPRIQRRTRIHQRIPRRLIQTQRNQVGSLKECGTILTLDSVKSYPPPKQHYPEWSKPIWKPDPCPTDYKDWKPEYNKPDYSKWDEDYEYTDGSEWFTDNHVDNFPKSFTSTFVAFASPDQVVGSDNKAVPGLDKAFGTFAFGLNSKNNVVCYVRLLTGLRRYWGFWLMIELHRLSQRRVRLTRKDRYTPARR